MTVTIDGENEMMTKLLRIDKFTDDNKKPTTPRNATYRYIHEFNEDDTVDTMIQWSASGWDIETEKNSIMYYEGDEIPDKYEGLDDEEEEIEEEEIEEAFVEKDHPREND